jgi:predicted dinucleotide-binding enzyme
MKIGIIGAGNVGTGIGRLLAAKGHEIVVSFSKTPEALEQAAVLIGGGARPGSLKDAVAHGDVVLLATPWGVTLETVRGLAAELAGKILWDTTNPLKPDMSGLQIGTETSGGEEVAKAAPAALVVKAIAPFAEVLHSPSTRIAGVKPGVFVCGEDAGARKTVLRLIDDLDAAGVDAGPLSLARYTEPLGMLLVQLAYMNGFGARIASVLIQDKPS